MRLPLIALQFPFATLRMFGTGFKHPGLGIKFHEQSVERLWLFCSSGTTLTPEVRSYLHNIVRIVEPIIIHIATTKNCLVQDQV
jgi:hypothetical protein